jgi:hypothetical protein
LLNGAADMTVPASSVPSGEGLLGETFCRKAAGWVLLLALVSIGHAQTEPLGTRLGEQVETTLTDPAFQQGGWDAFRLVPPPMSPSWSYGDFSALLTAVAQVSYDDNILQDNRERLEDLRFSFDPSVHLRWNPSAAPPGTGVDVFFSPQLDWFAKYAQFNTVNYYGGADLAAFFGNSTARLQYRTAVYSEPGMLQTDRNQEHTEAVTLDATHELGGKTRLSSNFELGYGEIFGGAQYWEAGGRLFLEYHARERLALGLGYGLRYADTDPGLTLLFNEPQAELLWAYTDRLHMSLRAGVQIGTVEDSAAAGTQIGPLVAGSLSYATSDKTDLRLDLSRQRWPSYYSTAQLDELSRLTLALHHRFSDRVFANLDGDIGYDTQTSPLTGGVSAGSYAFWEVGCLVGYMLTPHMDCALTYRYMQRTSNLDTPNFDRNVIGIRLNYRF